MTNPALDHPTSPNPEVTMKERAEAALTDFVSWFKLHAKLPENFAWKQSSFGEAEQTIRAYIAALEADVKQLNGSVKDMAHTLLCAHGDFIRQLERYGFKGHEVLAHRALHIEQVMSRGRQIIHAPNHFIEMIDDGTGAKKWLMAKAALTGPLEFPPDNNDNYECKCIQCGKHFIGYKRRIVCDNCAGPDGKVTQS